MFGHNEKLDKAKKFLGAKKPIEGLVLLIDCESMLKGNTSYEQIMALAEINQCKGIAQPISQQSGSSLKNARLVIASGNVRILNAKTSR